MDENVIASESSPSETCAPCRPSGSRASLRVVRQPRREGGFIAITTAILLIVMLMATALALDVAIWYSRGLALQRTADAAALAGVVRMPNFTAAEAAAREVATRNGLDPAAITIQRDPNSPRRIQVQTSQDVKSFFGKMIRESTLVSRKSTAEFVSSIDMGSKLNGIGTGDLLAYPSAGLGTQDFWLAINGYCTAKEDGDRFASAFDGNRAGGFTSCGPIGGSTVKNLDFRVRGTDAAQYTYLVQIPCPTPGQDPCLTNPVRGTVVEIYNPMFDMSNSAASLDTNIADPLDPNFLATNMTTFFGIRDPNGLAIPALPQQAFGTCNDCSAGNGWRPLFTIPASLGAGTFRIDVDTQENETFSYGSNVFSLLSHWEPANPLAPAADEIIGDCPSCAPISGESTVSVFANASGNTVDFFLARLAPAGDFRGKRIQILLWDIGEGADSISILQPDGTPIGFKYRTFDHGLDGVAADQGFGYPTAVPEPGGVLDVSGTASALPVAQKPPWDPIVDRANDFKFNGRLVALEVTVPTDYGCVPLSRPCSPIPLAGDGWWKIRYTTSLGSVFDRSTWTVRLLGDPVHLVAK